MVLVAVWKLAQIFTPGVLHLTVLQQERITNLGRLEQYRDANKLLPPDPDRVVFFGDSITYGWDLDASFHDSHFINRGINGQTTSDMLVRFRQDAIDLRPKAVVILAGVNDFGENNAGGDIDKRHKIANVQSNISTMAELAEAHRIRPVFLSLLPINDYTEHGKLISHLVSADLVAEQNEWLQTFCETHGYLFVDLYSNMVDQRGKLRVELSDDGLHPNKEGYKIMAAVFARSFHE